MAKPKPKPGGFNITVPKPPPKKTAKTTHSWTYYWRAFVKYYGKDHPNLSSQADQIRLAAKSAGIQDPILFAAYLLAQGGIPTDYNKLVQAAKAYSIVVGSKTGIPPGVEKVIKQFINIKAFKGYTSQVGTVGTALTLKQTKQQAAAPGQLRAAANKVAQFYLGRNASKEEAAVINGTKSNYQKLLWLSTRPGFYSSPVWQAKSGDYIAEWQTIMGTDPTLKAPKKLIAKAIAAGWDQQAFYEHIRLLPQYERGVEFKQMLASHQTIYEQIYGAATSPEAKKNILQAARAGMQPDAYAKFLREQPEYAWSNEQQGNLAKGSAWWGQAATFTPYVKPTPPATEAPPPPPKPKPKPPVRPQPPVRPAGTIGGP